MKMKRVLALMCALAMLAPVCAFAEGETIKLGGIGPLSGSTAQYGNAVREGVDLFIEEINAAGGVNGQQVEILWEDSKGDALEATNAFNKLVDNDGVVGIIGPVLSGESLAVAPLASDAGIPMISPSATSYEVTTDRPSVFRSCFLDPFQAQAMANYANDQGMKKVAVIYDNSDDYSVGLANEFKAQAEKNGQEVVAFEAATAKDVDFRSQLTNIVTAGPEALFVAFYYEPAAMILNQSVEVGLDCKFLGADGIGGVEDLVSDTALLSKTYYCAHFANDADDENVKTFIESYKAKYGEEPKMAFSATGYDAVKILVNAIAEAGSTDSAAVVEKIKDTDLDCVTGHITFDDHNDPVKNAYIMNYVDGQPKYVDTVEPEA